MDKNNIKNIKANSLVAPSTSSEQKPKKMYDEMDFFEMMEANMDDFHTRRSLVESVIKNAQEGDSGALKILERALLESKYKNENKLIVSDEQLRNIILLAADRVRGAGEVSTSA